MIDWLKGKKTYIVALVTGLLAAAESLGYPIPPAVYAVLAALGFTALRAGVSKA